MSVIILAAGQGARMGKLTSNLPKSLMPFGSDSVIVRLLKQILDFYEGDITVVVGYMRDQVKNTLIKNFGNRVNIVENNQYQNDVNILSLYKAIEFQQNPDSFFVFEADCVFDRYAMEKIFSAKLRDFSSWFTIGAFKRSMVGGIVKSDKHKNVYDLKIVKKYEKQYKNYNKLIGVLKVGSNEAKAYINFLNKEIQRTTRQYYLAPWINNLELLSCLETELGANHADAFNTADAYYKALNMFDNEVRND